MSKNTKKAAAGKSANPKPPKAKKEGQPTGAKKPDAKSADKLIKTPKQAAIKTEEGRKFYFEPTEQGGELMARLGNSRLGLIVKVGDHYQIKIDRAKTKLEFTTPEKAAERMVKAREARKAYRAIPGGWKSLSDEEKAKLNWIADEFRFMWSHHPSPTCQGSLSHLKEGGPVFISTIDPELIRKK